MRFTYSWLCEYLTPNLSASELIGKLNELGFEVEAVINRKPALASFIIAEITHASQHPEADRLKLCKVNDGNNIIDIVCGGSNARTGIKVVLAPVGAVIPSNNLTIKASTIRGAASNGMLCSADELDLSDYFICPSSGIIELNSDSPVGANFASHFGLDDLIIDIDVTPNRGDALSIYGLARDLAAAGYGTLKPLTQITKPVAEINPEELKISINHADCRKFTAVKVANTNNKLATPFWLKSRLVACGYGSQSLLVDIGNYVMHALGQPLHIYDAKYINDLTVATAQNNEQFDALDGKTYELSSEVMTVQSRHKTVAIAGVIGGKDSSCNVDTNNIIIEAAYFMPEAVIKTGRAVNVHSEARHRFERNCDPMLPESAAQLATNLVTELASGKIVASHTVTNNDLPTAKPITLTTAQFSQLIGYDLELNTMANYLTQLGCSVDINASTITATPPSWRHDLTITADLIEEIIRLHGYNNIPMTPLPPTAAQSLLPLNDNNYRSWRAIKTLTSLGLNEVICWSMTSINDHSQFTNAAPITIKNPLNSELTAMRPSLLPNLLKQATINKRHQQPNYHIFEIGPVFSRDYQQLQQDQIAILRCGQIGDTHYLGNDNADFYYAKHDLVQLAPTLGLKPSSLRFQQHDSSFNIYHPNKSADVYLGNKLLARIGELHPLLLKHYQLAAPVSACEIILANLPPAKASAYYRGNLDLTQVPAVYRDFAIVVPKSMPAFEVQSAITKADRKLITNTTIFDIYVGNQIAAECKSLAIKVTMQAKHTLSDQEIDNCYSKIISAIEKLGGNLRT
ncbi:MAG: phenylalanine--tRNA ligase subunit beta [Pseudomonadota bacterium]